MMCIHIFCILYLSLCLSLSLYLYLSSFPFEIFANCPIVGRTRLHYDCCQQLSQSIHVAVLPRAARVPPLVNLILLCHAHGDITM